jgi:hypothetical protein
MELSWDEICDRGKQHNKTVICEVERCGQRYFKVKCNLCEIETVLRAYSFKSCLKCRTKSLYYIHFITKAYNRHAGKFDYSLTKYINSKTKVKIICKKCNIIFLQKPNDHLNGQGCPQCNESKGELRVTKYLSEKNIRISEDNYEKARIDIFGGKCFTTWNLGFGKYYNGDKDSLLFDLN